MKLFGTSFAQAETMGFDLSSFAPDVQGCQPPHGFRLLDLSSNVSDERGHASNVIQTELTSTSGSLSDDGQVDQQARGFVLRSLSKDDREDQPCGFKLDETKQEHASISQAPHLLSFFLKALARMHGMTNLVASSWHMTCLEAM